MGFFKQLFGSSKVSVKKQRSQAELDELQRETDRTWALLKETLAYYDSIACPCAFPRFIQYTSIDCVDMSGSFYMSETEGFIQHAGPYYEISETDKGQENHRNIYTCKKCASTFEFGWADFSIYVSRSFLKPVKINVKQAGADARSPIPFYIGFFGHKLPDLSLVQKVSFEVFQSYIRS